MRPPVSPGYLLVLVIGLVVLIAFIQVGILRITFEKLGLSQGSAITLVLLSLGGSLFNLPMFRIRAERPPPELRRRLSGLLRVPEMPFTGYTVIAMNLGGGVIPAAFSLYLIGLHDLSWFRVVVGIAAVAAVAYGFSRPVAGLGIALPIFVAPVTAALVALLLNAELAAPLAYVSGSMGVLLGADVLRLPDVRKLGAPIASMGGAGTFDGIFLTGIIAALLA
jgi:uncharacterized membrane protein